MHCMCSYEQFITAWKGKQLHKDKFKGLVIRAHALPGIQYGPETRIIPGPDRIACPAGFYASLDGRLLPLANQEALYPYLRTDLTKKEQDVLLGGELAPRMLTIDSLTQTTFEAAARLVPKDSARKRWEILLIRMNGADHGYGNDEFIQELLAAMPYVGR